MTARPQYHTLPPATRPRTDNHGESVREDRRRLGWQEAKVNSTVSPINLPNAVQIYFWFSHTQRFNSSRTLAVTNNCI